MHVASSQNNEADVSPALSAQERAFLIEHSGLSPQVLDPEAIRLAREARDAARRAAEGIGWSDLSTGDLLQIPDFGRVIEEFPPEYLPIDIDAALTAPAEEFDGRTPADALRSGLPVHSVVAWAESLQST